MAVANMAEWMRPPNSSIADLAEMAMAGMDFASHQEAILVTTVAPKASLSDVSDLTELLGEGFKDKLECGHYQEFIVDGHKKLYSTKDLISNSNCTFWTEGVLSLCVAIFGLIGNFLSIWVLSVPEMRSTAFNKLLLALAMIDCMFIGPGILIYIFKAFKLEYEWHTHLFPYLLYPCSEIALCSSIYMTVAIAIERFIGLCRPFRRLSTRPCPAKAYIFPVLIFSIGLNIPKFLESETKERSGWNAQGEKVTFTDYGVTSLRVHPDYILYYTMWTRLLITGIFPFAMLAGLYTKIYLAMRRSRAQLRTMAIRAALPMAILGKPSAGTQVPGVDLRIDSSNWSQNGHRNGLNGTSQAPPPQTPPNPKPHPMNRSVSAAVVESRIKREPIARSQSTAAATPLRNGVHAPQNPPPSNQPSQDLNLAPVLFGIIIVFVICNSLRLFLNFYDFSARDEIISCEQKGVGRYPPLWVACSVSVSNMLLMVNSSVNFLVYCVVGSKFRSILCQQLSGIFKKFCSKQSNQPNSNGSDLELLPKRNNHHNRILEPKHPRILEVHHETAANV